MAENGVSGQTAVWTLLKWILGIISALFVAGSLAYVNTQAEAMANMQARISTVEGTLKSSNDLSVERYNNLKEILNEVKADVKDVKKQLGK